MLFLAETEAPETTPLFSVSKKTPPQIYKPCRLLSYFTALLQKPKLSPSHKSQCCFFTHPVIRIKSAVTQASYSKALKPPPLRTMAGFFKLVRSNIFVFPCWTEVISTSAVSAGAGWNAQHRCAREVRLGGVRDWVWKRERSLRSKDKRLHVSFLPYHHWIQLASGL